MIKLAFTWDPVKARVNLRKHFVSFEEAESVFYDEHARLIYDPDHSQTEHRFLLLGVSSKLRVLVVSHCYREKENTIRIISARPANKKERNQYISHLP